jgi:hypothetical protein
LDRRISPIPSSVVDSLESQRGQILFIVDIDSDLHKHLIKAIDEYELGHYLAAALIAGKSVAYVISKLEGQTDEEKVENLVRKKLLDPKLRENFLKGSRKARNLYTHDLGAVPEPQEVLSALSDAIDIGMKFCKSLSPL